MKRTEPTRQADLLPQHCGVQVGDIARVASKRALGIQREGDGDRDVDGARVLQQEGDLGAGASLSAGHHHALRRGRLVQTVFYCLILRHAEVQLVEAQQEGVPVLREDVMLPSTKLTLPDSHLCIETNYLYFLQNLNLESVPSTY